MAKIEPLLERHLDGRVRAALRDTPVVTVVGPRQAGKTTLCRLVTESRKARFVTLDDAFTLAAAHADPAAFIGASDDLLVIDEIQRAPALLPAIKLAVDRYRRPGRFLLTGSANVLTLPRVSESLAGRMEVMTLWTLSQGELDGRRESFVDAVFGDGPISAPGAPATRLQIIRRALRGGYPEIRQRPLSERREAWFDSYVTAPVQRDLRDLSRLENVTAIPRLLSLLAARAGAVLNIADLSRTLAVPHTTLARYLALLETIFLLKPIPAWATGRAVRVLKSPRIVVTDTGLLAHLSGLDEARIEADPTAAGPLFENFVAMEIVRQFGWSRTRANLYHFRTYAGVEVDFVIEANDGRVVAIEVKAGQVREGDFKGLRAFADLAGRKFARGVILWPGEQVVPFGPNLSAVPISRLWQ